MNTSELKKIIETAETLGYSDVQIVLNDSRDGEESYPAARARFIKLGTHQDPQVVLAFSYEP